MGDIQRVIVYKLVDDEWQGSWDEYEGQAGINLYRYSSVFLFDVSMSQNIKTNRM